MYCAAKKGIFNDATGETKQVLLELKPEEANKEHKCEHFKPRRRDKFIGIIRKIKYCKYCRNWES